MGNIDKSIVELAEQYSNLKPNMADAFNPDSEASILGLEVRDYVISVSNEAKSMCNSRFDEETRKKIMKVVLAGVVGHVGAEHGNLMESLQMVSNPMFSQAIALGFFLGIGLAAKEEIR